jgi:hypothetical protein
MISKHDLKNLNLLTPESENPAKLSELAETERSRAKIRFAFFFVASWIIGAVFRSESIPSP